MMQTSRGTYKYGAKLRKLVTTESGGFLLGMPTFSVFSPVISLTHNRASFFYVFLSDDVYMYPLYPLYRGAKKKLYTLMYIILHVVVSGSTTCLGELPGEMVLHHMVIS